jgi:hypothetical protein
MMRMRVPIIAAVIALVPCVDAVAQAADIDQIRAWIAEHHPQVYNDTTLNTVLIVLNSNGTYASSIAARFDSAEVAATDFRFAQLAEIIAAREGNRQVDTLMRYACSGGKTHSANRPLCILDGVRVDAFSSVQGLTMHKLETVTGAAATARYGPDAANGVVIGSTTASLLERYRALGVTAANMGSMQTNRVRAGTVGPRRLDITIVFLKPPNGAQSEEHEKPRPPITLDE